ncbi:MAG: HIT domain-containing protein [Candidatus Pacearchaeota archaeon]
MLNQEEIKSIKEQLIKYIEKGLPFEEQEFAKQKILSMDPNQLEEFLKENNILIKRESINKCVFCSILKGEISAYKIDENKEALAILEINPLSKAHTLIIPKQHTEEYDKKLRKNLDSLTKKVSKKIKEKLKPKDIIIQESSLFGHKIINIIPNYEENKDILFNRKREAAKPEELIEIQNLLLAKKMRGGSKKTELKKINIKKGRVWLPKRIP